MLNRDYGKNGCGPKGMADGGSVGENVGFWERVKAGNIDQPGSEAYNRWGAGRSADIASSDARQLSRNNEATAVAPATSTAPVDNTSDAQSRRMASPKPEPVPEASTSDLNAIADANDKATPAATAVAPVVRRRSSAGSSAAPRTMQGGIASGYSVGRGILADAEDERRVAATETTRPSGQPVSNMIRNGLDSIKKSFESTPEHDVEGQPVSNYLRRLTRSNPNPAMANGGLVGGDRYYGKK